MMDQDWTVAEFANNVQSGAIGPSAVAEQALARAEASAELNAFLWLDREHALAQAAELEARQRRGETLGPLAGVPIAIKDALCVRGAPTAAGSRMLTRDGKNYSSAWRPDYDATVVSRLRAADAIILGKTNMDEFAMGSSNENSAFGAVKNPWDLERIPGGSSGGSAAVVAARALPAALGSDTGGSIRQPAGHSGIVGVKPSYGRVSRYGLIAFASSLDQVGPMTTDVRGAARVLRTIAGLDVHDSTCANVPVGDYEAACERDVRGLRIGIPREYFAEGLDASVREAVTSVLDALRAQGAQLVNVELPHTEYGVSTYYLLATAEASSNLSRFDGVRFGSSVQQSGDLIQSYEKSRGGGFGAEVKRRIMLGTYALSAGYYDAYYQKAQRVRTLIRNDFRTAFDKADVLLTPVSPTAAFRIGEKVDDPLKMYLADIYSVPASLAGIAGLSVPAGLDTSRSERPLPIGVQMLAPPFEEERLFTVAAAWEHVSPVRGRKPAQTLQGSGL